MFISSPGVFSRRFLPAPSPGAQIPGKQIGVYSLGGSLTGHNWTASLTASLMGAVHLCYHHAIAPDFQVGVDMEANYAQQESTTNVGFQYEMPKVYISDGSGRFYF